MSSQSEPSVLSARLLDAAHRFEEALLDPERAQQTLLGSILRWAASSEYGVRHGFSTIGGIEEYRRRVPIFSYGDLDRHVNRMMKGEHNVMFPGQPVFYARTSGTTGKPKIIPFSSAIEVEYDHIGGPTFAWLERDHPGALSKGFYVSAILSEEQAPGGTTIGSASGFARRQGAFPGGSYRRCAPEAVFEETDFEVRYYALLFFAIRRSLKLLGALNPSTILTLLKKCEVFGESLVADLAEGTLRRGPTGTERLGQAIQAELSPEPEAAARLSSALDSPAGLDVRRLWPDLSVINTWKGGSTKHYLDVLSKRVSGCTIRSLMSGSSEAALLIPMDDNTRGGVPAICSTFFEFLPVDRDPEPRAFVPLADLSDETAYRIAVTNHRGLYRLLMDDQFHVEGRYNGIPVLALSHRMGVVSSLTGEKLNESDVVVVLAKASENAHTHVEEFIVAPVWADPPYYVLCLEPTSDLDPAHLERMESAFEARLQETNLEYRQKRLSSRLAPVRLVCLEKGAFERRMKAQSAGRSDAQMKVRRLETAVIDEKDLADWIRRGSTSLAT